MSIRFLRSFGLALLMACSIAVPVLAKGGYSFITIAGPDLKETLRTNDSTLTEDYFGFADFYRDRVEAPTDAGVGYEITRYYMDAGREVAFDCLHYYPATGFVYYDGLINGSSEYDGKWYIASLEIKPMFEAIVVGVPIGVSQPANSGKDASTEPATSSSQPAVTLDPTRFIVPIAIAAGLAVTILVSLSRRKTPSQ